MMNGLAKEVCRRMMGEEVFGTRVTLKVKQRKPNAKPPPKFLGHGSCFNLSRSTDTPDGAPTRDADAIASLGMTLFSELGVEDSQVRGMGIIMSKLASPTASMSGRGLGSRRLTSWFEAAKTQTMRGGIAEEPSVSTAPEAAELCHYSNSFQEKIASLVTGDKLSPKASVRLLGDDGSASTADVTNEVSSPIDLFVPSLSQIHMSQVEALPSPMKRQIKTKLNLEKDSVETEPYRKETTSEVEDRLHQVSLKRMFQLAAVKSGKDDLSSKLGDSISVTQLECLPLEMQLQIANGDAVEVGSVGRSGLLQKRTRRHPPCVIDVDTEERRVLQKVSARESPSVVDGDAELTILDGSGRASGLNPAKISAATTHQRFVAVEEDDEVLITGGASGSKSFYQDNIVPLRTWMDENNPDSPQAFQKAEQFLTACVDEQRLKDATVLLRSIRNRTDQWTSEDTFRRLCSAVDDRASKVYGRRINMCALGLLQR